MEPRPLRNLAEHRFALLLSALAILLTIYPFQRDHAEARVAFLIWFQSVIVAGLFAVRGSRRFLGAALVLAVASLVLTWLPRFVTLGGPDVARAVEVAGSLATALYLLWLVVFVLRDLFASRSVTTDRLYGSLSAYLLLALAWGFLYTALELASPGSFALAEGLEAPAGAAPEAREGTLFYFSFVTLTTLGYGDVRPLGATAQMLVMWEAVVGQAYLTILVARLVGLHVSASSKS